MRRSRNNVENGTGKKRRRRPNMRWELGSAAGLISGVIVIAGTALLAASGRFEIAYNFSRLVPISIRNFMERETAISQPPDVIGKALGKIQTIAPPAQRQSVRKLASFGIGDSQDTVLRIQGEPTSRSGNVWHYGTSQVTFVGGRVVGWSNSSAHPLRVR
jgi:hypothetical protein